MLQKSRIVVVTFTVLGVLVLLGFTPLRRQLEGGLEEIVAKLNAFQQNYPQEKVYLHLDKPYYAAGDDIWFKAYLLNASTHEPSLLSSVLYVDLINQEDSIYKRVVVNMERGLGRGDFALEDTIPEGLYRLRAYTSWMQNFDQGYFFHQNLQIFNPRVADLVPAVEFEFKPQEKGDSVYANILLRNLKEEPLANREVSFYTRTGKKITGRRKRQTNDQGATQYRFYLPAGEEREHAQLWLGLKEGTGQVQRHFPIPKTTAKTDLQFFPEGGDLVQNMWSIVGFKAVDAYGLGKEVQGSVFDDTGKKVADFQSLKFGMGRFGFYPQAGRKYTAVLKDPEAGELSYRLPEVKAKGVVMAVDNSKAEAVQVKVFMVGFAGESGRPAGISVIAQSRGVVYFTGYSTTEKDLLLIQVPRQKLPTGVVQLTLFSDAGEPLAERLVFVNHQDQLQLTLTPDRPSYKPREKVTMHLQARNAAGNPVSGHFSVAVTDARKVSQEANKGTILSNLLLTSDLQGYIESPNYYFSSTEKTAAQALDNLMLTQGWRRFIWKDLLQGKEIPLPLPLEQGMAVTGVVQKLSGKPEPRAVVNLVSFRGPGMMLIDTTDAQGRFAFGVPNLDDSARVAVKARSAKGKDLLQVILDKDLPIPPVTPRVPYSLPPSLLSQTTWAYLKGNREQLRLDQLSGKSILLSAIEIRGKKETVEERLRQGQLYSQPDRSFKGSDLPLASDIVTALQGRLGGNGLSMRGGGTPMFLVDGMPAELDYVKTISMQDVEMIDVLRPGVNSGIYGPQGIDGVISIILKRGGSGEFLSSARYRGVAPYNGVRSQIAREFYMPLYDKPSEVEMPDFRTTLYWSPSVITNSDGQASFSFFSADPATTYTAVIEGLTANGRLGRTVTEVQVK